MAARSESEAAPQQLLTYVFGPGADFGGMLVGALQRIESGGAIRIVEILFVARGSEPHELVAVSRAASSAGMIGKLISFRLEDTARAAETEQALGGPRGGLVRELAAALDPGCAVVGLVVEHAWVQVVADAVARTGGAPLVGELLAPAEVDAAWTRLPSQLSQARASD